MGRLTEVISILNEGWKDKEQYSYLDVTQDRFKAELAIIRKDLNKKHDSQQLLFE